MHHWSTWMNRAPSNLHFLQPRCPTCWRYAAALPGNRVDWGKLSSPQDLISVLTNSAWHRCGLSSNDFFFFFCTKPRSLSCWGVDSLSCWFGCGWVCFVDLSELGERAWRQTDCSKSHSSLPLENWLASCSDWQDCSSIMDGQRTTWKTLVISH